MRVVKKADDRRKEIIQAAREHFQTEEFRKITMQNILDVVGIAKGTLYHHFKSKSELLEAVVDEVVDDDYKGKKDLLEKYHKKTALEKFVILLTHESMAENNKKLLENLHHPDNAHAHARQLGKIILKIAPLFASVIAQGCKEGVFNVKHPLETAEFLISGLQYFTDIGFYPWDNNDLQRRMMSFPALLESQLGAPKGSFDFLLS